jgi:hypothetical protein
MPVDTSRPSPRLVLFASVVVLCAGAIAGCGGSGGSSSTKAAAAPTQTASYTPPQSNADVGGAAVQGSHHKTSRRGHKSPGHALGRAPAPGDSIGPAGTVQGARPNPTREHDSGSVGVKPVNPCKLVSKAEAQSITGRAVTASIEAPLGPTCIYQLSGSKSEITLQVESVSFTQATHQLSKRTQVTVRDHKSYCGSLGTQMLFVPLAGGTVLHVTAPCAIAQRFAALALSRLAV